MRRIWSMAVLPVALLASIAGGCETEPSSSPIIMGGTTLRLTTRSIDDFQIIYEGLQDRLEIHFLFSNLDILEHSSALYEFWILGFSRAHYYEIDRHVGGNGWLDAWCQIYSESLSPLYKIHFGLYPNNFSTSEEDPRYLNFEGPIEYTLIEGYESLEGDSNVIAYQSNSPDDYILEFIGENGTDIHNNADQIEEQVDILSRNYVIMDSGMTRYVSISDSSERR